MSRGLVWRTLRAPTHRQGKLSVTPVAQAAGLRWGRGGWLWLFPVAVEVRHDGKPEKKPDRLPVIDVTRLVLILFIVGTLLVWVGSRRRPRRRRENNAVRN